MTSNLSIELLRNFVAIVDAGSMSRAAERVNLTQSALSLQMKKLASLTKAPLFERHHRGVILTNAGKTFLAYSRVMIELNDRAISSLGDDLPTEPIRIAMVQDFVDLVFSRSMLQIAQADRSAQLQIRVGSSAELVGQFLGGLHDIVLCIGSPGDPNAITTAKVAWLGNPGLCREPWLPVALMEKPCVFRDTAINSLEASGRDYRVVLETPSIAVLRSAINAGIALTCRPPSFMSNEILPLANLDVALPQIAYCLHVSPAATPAIRRIANIIRNAVSALSAGEERLHDVT